MFYRTRKTFCLLILAAAVAEAREYYIAPNGNDTHDGSINSPWATARRGVDHYNPGDTIYVRAGTYAPTGSMYFYRSGTPAAPITFRAYPGETAVLDGANMAADANVVYISAKYFVMQDLEVRNGKLNGITVEDTSNVTVRNCKVRDAVHSGILVGKRDLTSTHDIIVESCTVYNNVHMNDAHTLNSGWAGALVAGGAVNVTFKNNTVYNNQGEGIIFYLADRCSALNNVSHDNFGVNLYLDNATNCVVSGNFLYCAGDTAYFAHGAPASGIQNANEAYPISNPSANNSIVNNILVKNNYGFYFGNYGAGGALKNFTFANNSIYLSNQDMIHVDAGAHSNAVFVNNISFQSDGGDQTKLPASLDGLNFSHNLWFGGDVGAAWTEGDIYADPQFVNAGTFNAADYKLKEGSPAIEKGISGTGVTTDFFGVTRTAPTDLGASETSANDIDSLAFLSAPTASPNPAVVGQIVSLSASAISTSGAGVSYNWDLGDGSTQTGASVTKAFANAGTYSVTVTAGDGTANKSVTFSVIVTAGNNVPPAGELLVTTLGMNFNLSRPGVDTLRANGSVTLPEGFNPNGANIVIGIGSYQRTVTLNARGASTDRTFRLTGRMSRGAFKSSAVGFVLSIRRADLFGQFADLQFSDSKGLHTQEVGVGMTVAGSTATANAIAAYRIAGVR